jgi:hypothetical protein
MQKESFSDLAVAPLSPAAATTETSRYRNATVVLGGKAQPPDILQKSPRSGFGGAPHSSLCIQERHQIADLAELEHELVSARVAIAVVCGNGYGST